MASRTIRNFRGFLWAFSAVLVICIAGIPAHASNSCPWLNEATASGLLGNEAIGSYSAAASPGQPANCTFTQRSGASFRTLVIEVEITPDAAAKTRLMEKACSSERSPLQAIGNEAVICAEDDRGGRVGERVVGRVRDQVFMIRISSSFKNDPILTREALKTRVSTAAEQVAGNLF